MDTINKKIGILGGGQLGRMFIQEAISFNLHLSILDPNPNCPCAYICNSFTQGDFSNYQDVLNFGRTVEILTIEIEHVNTQALFQLQKEGIKVFPQPQIIELIKDKGTQKQFYQEHNIPTAPFYFSGYENLPLPLIAKSRTGGYDGKGVQMIKNQTDFQHPFFSQPFFIEEKIEFEKELSIIVARNEIGETISYPMVEQQFNKEANLVEFLFSPAKVTAEIEKKGKEIAHQIIQKLQMVGILAVELFLTKKGDLLVNEIAPRPHNSGHHTIEANVTSQFQQHIRTLLNLPLGSPKRLFPAVMLNLLGEKEQQGEVHYQGLTEILKTEGVFIHLYGKKQTKPYRKMGHITITDDEIEKAIKKAKTIQSKTKVLAKK